MNMHILVADALEQAGLDGLEALGCTVHAEPDLDASGIREAVERTSADVLVVRSTKVPGDAMGDSLRAIIRAGAGYDNIDCAAAGARGIRVCNCPGMNADAVAELAIGLMVCADRRIPEQCRLLADGRWEKKAFGVARGLKGRSLGVIGAGSIGQGMIRRARAFDMHVHAWSRSMSDGKAATLGVENGGTTREDLLHLASTMDVVSVHLAAAPETDGLLDRAFFEAMKPGAIFINTARGSVVDQDAMVDVAKRNGLRIATDVYQNQPASKSTDWDCLVASLDHAVTTHHIGASTDQAQEAVALEVVRIVETLTRDGEFLHCVNADEIVPELETGARDRANA